MNKATKFHRIGPGGIRCNCCRPMGTVQKTKTYLRRYDRRVTRMGLNINKVEM